MLLVYPLRELVRFLPVLIGLLRGRQRVRRDAGALADPGHRIPIALGLLRYVTTSFRIADERVELQARPAEPARALHALDRVRTVDLTASPIHRVLGPDDGADRHRAPRRPAGRGRPRPRRAARAARPRAARGAAPGRRPRRRQGPQRASRPPRLRPAAATGSCSGSTRRWAAVRAADQRRAWCWPRRCSVSAASSSTSWRFFDSLDPGRQWSIGRRPSGRLLVPAVLLLLGLAAVGAGRGRLPGHQLGLHPDPRRRRAVLAPDPGPAHHPRDQPRRRPGQRRHDRRAARACGWPVAAGSRRSSPGSTATSAAARPWSHPPRAPWSRGSPARCSARTTRSRLRCVRTVRAARTRRYTRALVPGARRWPSPRSCWSPSASGASGALASSRWRSWRRSPWPPTGSGRSGTRWSTATSSRGRAACSASREVLATSGVIGWNLRSTWFQRRAGLTMLVATTAGGSAVGHRDRRTRGRRARRRARRRTRAGGAVPRLTPGGWNGASRVRPT